MKQNKKNRFTKAERNLGYPRAKIAGLNGIEADLGAGAVIFQMGPGGLRRLFAAKSEHNQMPAGS